MKLSDHAKAAWAAYAEDALSPKPEKDLGFTDVTFLTRNRGFVGMKDGQIHVYIKGTSSPGDFIRDADIALAAVSPAITKAGDTSETWRGVKIHAGFWGEVLDLHHELSKVIDALRQAYPAATVLVLGGHSLGGAVATILAYMVPYWRWTFTRIELVTCGSPRCGNPAWAALAAASGVVHTRIVHDRDLVPQIPRSLWWPPSDLYVHVGKLLHLAPDGSKLRWFHRFARWLTSDVPLLSDHPIAHYVQAIEASES